MDITSAVFKKGITDTEQPFGDTLPQYAFIGRSNVGKSTTINMLTRQKGLAKTSSLPGSTKQINFFLVNNRFYIADLPGYGYARASAAQKVAMTALINSYLFDSAFEQKKVILIIDGNIGPTKDDLAILEALEKHGKDIVIAVNKIDKLKKNDKAKRLSLVREEVGAHTIVPYSAEKKEGIGMLLAAILQ